LNQRAAAGRAGISQASWSRIERGHLAEVPLRTIRLAFGAVDARIDTTASWRGGAIDRLRDERHAQVVSATVESLGEWGWQPEIEVTFASYGERGSIDILAVRPEARLAVAVEVKSELTSVEETLRRIDVKARLVPQIVFDRMGWRPISVGRLLVLDATMTNRRRVSRMATILERAFPLRFDEARRWLATGVEGRSALLFVSSTRPRTQRDTARGRHG